MKILDFFSGSDRKLLLAGSVIILVMFGVNKCNYNRLQSAKHDAERLESNLKAAQDTIRITKSKNGLIEYNKLSFITKTLDELKKANNDLAKEVEETKGKVVFISKQEYKIIHDTIIIPSTYQVKDGVVLIASRYDTTYSKGNSRSLAINTQYNEKDSSVKAQVTKDEISFSAVTGLKKIDNGYEIFVRPQYPNMILTDLQGAYVGDIYKETYKRQPLLTLGFHIGYTPFTYDLKTKKGDLNLNRLGAGIGANFNLLSILSRKQK